jgi:hypothetical protein
MKIENWERTDKPDKIVWKHTTGISVLLKREGPIYVLTLYDKAGREQFRIHGTNKTQLEEKCANWQRDFNKHLKNKQGPTAVIQVAGGNAYFVKTEVEDAKGKWNDNYYVKDGYYVIHQGKRHHVYKLSKMIDETGYYTGYCQCSCPACTEGKKHCQGLVCKGD